MKLRLIEYSEPYTPPSSETSTLKLTLGVSLLNRSSNLDIKISDFPKADFETEATKLISEALITEYKRLVAQELSARNQRQDFVRKTAQDLQPAMDQFIQDFEAQHPEYFI